MHLLNIDTVTLINDLSTPNHSISRISQVKFEHCGIIRFYRDIDISASSERRIRLSWRRWWKHVALTLETCLSRLRSEDRWTPAHVHVNLHQQWRCSAVERDWSRSTWTRDILFQPTVDSLTLCALRRESHACRMAVSFCVFCCTCTLLWRNTVLVVWWYSLITLLEFWVTRKCFWPVYS